MADSKITALTADTAPSSDDLVVTVNDPAGTPANRKVTLANILTRIPIRRQNNTTDSDVTARIEVGWGFITAAGGEVTLSEAVTFPTAFSVLPIVVASFLGKKTGSDPSTAGDQNSAHAVPTSAKPYTTSTTGFTIHIDTTTGFTANDRVIYSWIAIGAA